MRKYITEFIGTFFLVITIGMTVGGANGNFAPIAIGATLMAMVFAGGYISGAHYNPAVTLAVLIRGKISVGDAIAYMIVQIAGAALAGLVVDYMVGDTVVNTIAIADTTRGIIGELVGTFALAYVVLNVATAVGTSGNSFYGLAIGFTVMSMAYAFGGISKGAFNPAVAISLSVMHFAPWSDIWVYVVGCFSGGALAALAFRFINNEENPPAVKTRA